MLLNGITPSSIARLLPRPTTLFGTTRTYVSLLEFRQASLSLDDVIRKWRASEGSQDTGPSARQLTDYGDSYFSGVKAGRAEPSRESYGARYVCASVPAVLGATIQTEIRLCSAR